MKSINLLTLGILTFGGFAPLMAVGTTVQARPGGAQMLVAQAPQADIQLKLRTFKQVEVKDAQGNSKITWQPITNNAVLPGMIVRYVVTGENRGKGLAENLKVTQPVTNDMVYQLKSAKPINGTQVVFSIDNGQTFVAEPMVRVLEFTNFLPRFVDKPAPAEKYTHIRWQFNRSVKAGESFELSYQAQVK